MRHYTTNIAFIAQIFCPGLGKKNSTFHYFFLYKFLYNKFEIGDIMVVIVEIYWQMVKVPV
jgi:hypothetical protein